MCLQWKNGYSGYVDGLARVYGGCFLKAKVHICCFVLLPSQTHRPFATSTDLTEEKAHARPRDNCGIIRFHRFAFRATKAETANGELIFALLCLGVGKCSAGMRVVQSLFQYAFVPFFFLYYVRKTRHS